MINKVTLLGRVGKDAVTKQTQTGKTVSTFSVATSEGYKDDKGEWQNKTEWHNIVLWGSEYILPKIQKGVLVYLEGKVTTRSYETEGVKKYITEIVANTIKVINTASGESVSEQKTKTSEAQNTDGSGIETDGSTDDLPF